MIDMNLLPKVLAELRSKRIVLGYISMKIPYQLTVDSHIWILHSRNSYSTFMIPVVNV